MRRRRRSPRLGRRLADAACSTASSSSTVISSRGRVVDRRRRHRHPRPCHLLLSGHRVAGAPLVVTRARRCTAWSCRATASSARRAATLECLVPAPRVRGTGPSSIRTRGSTRSSLRPACVRRARNGRSSGGSSSTTGRHSRLITTSSGASATTGPARARCALSSPAEHDLVRASDIRTLASGRTGPSSHAGPAIRVPTFGSHPAPHDARGLATLFGTRTRPPRPVLLILVYGAFLAIVGTAATAQSVLVGAHFSIGDADRSRRQRRGDDPCLRQCLHPARRPERRADADRDRGGAAAGATCDAASAG